MSGYPPFNKPSGGKMKRSKVFRIIVTLLVLVAATYAVHKSLLTAVGSFLIATDPIEDAEIVVVLAGDGTGRRLMRAVELVHQGRAPRILVDGPPGIYDRCECDLAIEFAVNRGVPPEILDRFSIDAGSTLEESRLVDAELRRRGIRKALVVTSNFHTRRARSIFAHHTSGAVRYLFVEALYDDFQPDRWWLTRPGKKVVFLEYLKTLNSWIE